MLVSPQSIEASLTARRLQRWGGQTCMVSDADVAASAAARACLARHPDRSRAGAKASTEALGEAARVHAAQRIVMFTPATRQELQPSAASAFTGYLVKPLRAASLAARLTAAPELQRRVSSAKPRWIGRAHRGAGGTGQRGPVDPGRRGQ